MVESELIVCLFVDVVVCLLVVESVEDSSEHDVDVIYVVISELVV